MKPINRYRLRSDTCSIAGGGKDDCKFLELNCSNHGVVCIADDCYIPDEDGEYGMAKLDEHVANGQDELSLIKVRLDALKELWEVVKTLDDMGKGDSFAFGGVITVISERKRELSKKVMELTKPVT